MNPQKAIAPLLNSIIGMIPIVVFFLFDCILPYQFALIAALISFIFYLIIGVVLLKTTPPYTLIVSVFPFVFLIGLSAVEPFQILYEKQASVVLSVFIIVSFFIFTRIQGFFRAKILLKEDMNREFRMLRFEKDIYISKLVIYTQVFNLLAISIYQVLPPNYHTPTLDLIIYHLIILTLIAFHYMYEFVHCHFLKKQFVTEEWLPVINNKGLVYGKVALSESLASGNKYLHPVIRIALIHKGMLFLKEKASFFDTNVFQLDYPFERYLRYKEKLEDGLNETFITNGAPIDLPAHFIYKGLESNRLIYFYACNLKDEKRVSELNLENGKWWTSKQIEDNMGTGLFSTHFEKEYELLNATVLMADKLMRGIEEND